MTFEHVFEVNKKIKNIFGQISFSKKLQVKIEFGLRIRFKRRDMSVVSIIFHGDNPRNHPESPEVSGIAVVPIPLLNLRSINIYINNLHC